MKCLALYYSNFPKDTIFMFYYPFKKLPGVRTKNALDPHRDMQQGLIQSQIDSKNVKFPAIGQNHER